MNGKGDKMRQGVNWKKYRAEHERIFNRKMDHLALRMIRARRRFWRDALKPQRWPKNMGEVIRGER